MFLEEVQNRLENEEGKSSKVEETMQQAPHARSHAKQLQFERRWCIRKEHWRGSHRILQVRG